MPKIIENLETKLVDEARKQVQVSDYSGVTIRSIAKACGVGTGTVYNYFPSKDALLAALLLSDWNTYITTINEVSTCSDSPEPVVYCIYNKLKDFSEKHSCIFQDKAAAASFGSSVSRYHGLLRSQLAVPLQKFCNSTFAAEFIAESLLTWTIEGKLFNEIYEIVQNCF